MGHANNKMKQLSGCNTASSVLLYGALRAALCYPQESIG